MSNINGDDETTIKRRRTMRVSTYVWMDGSVARLGYFLKVFLKNLRTKVAQIFSNNLGYFLNLLILSKNAYDYFWGQVLWELGLLFILPSGHTDGWVHGKEIERE